MKNSFWCASDRWKVQSIFTARIARRRVVWTVLGPIDAMRGGQGIPSRDANSLSRTFLARVRERYVQTFLSRLQRTPTAGIPQNCKFQMCDFCIRSLAGWIRCHAPMRVRSWTRRGQENARGARTAPALWHPNGCGRESGTGASTGAFFWDKLIGNFCGVVGRESGRFGAKLWYGTVYW